MRRHNLALNAFTQQRRSLRRHVHRLFAQRCFWFWCTYRRYWCGLRLSASCHYFCHRASNLRCTSSWQSPHSFVHCAMLQEDAPKTPHTSQRVNAIFNTYSVCSQKLLSQFFMFLLVSCYQRASCPVFIYVREPQDFYISKYFTRQFKPFHSAPYLEAHCIEHRLPHYLAPQSAP